MWKRGEIAPKEQFLLFSSLLYIYIFLTSGVKLHIHLLNVVVQLIVLPTLATLICRGTDISKCFSDSLGIRDNESRLYIHCIRRKKKQNGRRQPYLSTNRNQIWVYTTRRPWEHTFMLNIRTSYYLHQDTHDTKNSTQGSRRRCDNEKLYGRTDDGQLPIGYLQPTLELKNLYYYIFCWEIH